MKKRYIAFAILMVILLAISCGPSAPPPEITDEQKSLAIEGIKEYPEVRDADVFQEEKNCLSSLSLTTQLPKREPGNLVTISCAW